MRRRRRAPELALAGALTCGGAALVLDRLNPLPLAPLGAGYGVVVTAEDGTPLRAFADAEGVWRYPVTPESVSPLYLQALLSYEDRWFYRHPGVNPLSLARAAVQALRHGRAVSGGSTLTMQVARLLEPQSRGLGGKLRQIARALQIEWHLPKRDILALYLNLAPYGGPLEGVAAASYAYLGRSAAELSHAEAALLAVLPQAPSRLRPDRHPQRAAAARDKVLDRLQAFGVWSPQVVADARQERVVPQNLAHPLLAPLLARRLKDRAPAGQALRTTIDARLQRTLEDLLLARSAGLPKRTSAAVLVVENRTAAVRAYLGSLSFLDAERYGHVDMVQALRSPGSTLKPLLYGLALEEGLIHSESLLVDAPQDFGGYRPSNFSAGFHGPVSAREALQRSLNIPAVDLLDRLGPALFVARLANGGLPLVLPEGASPNLAIILGGAATRLGDLVGAYTALGRGGLAAAPRYLPQQPLRERRMLTAEAAWVVFDMLASNPPPGRVYVGPWATGNVAWKTGTSYGFRDAWALGVSARYTVGVWVGRPDGTPVPDHYGAVTAAPILFDVLDTLPGGDGSLRAASRPVGVQSADICWPLGLPPEPGREALCQQRRAAWTIDGVTPPTLPDRDADGWTALLARFWVDPETGKRVDAFCQAPQRVRREVARWPQALEPWLSPDLRRRSAIPELDPRCGASALAAPSPITLVGVTDAAVLRRAGATGSDPSVKLQALGGTGKRYWLVDGALAQAGGETFSYRFRGGGTHELAVVDDEGHHDVATVRVVW